MDCSNPSNGFKALLGNRQQHFEDCSMPRNQYQVFRGPHARQPGGFKEAFPWLSVQSFTTANCKLEATICSLSCWFVKSNLHSSHPAFALRRICWCLSLSLSGRRINSNGVRSYDMKTIVIITHQKNSSATSVIGKPSRCWGKQVKEHMGWMFLKTRGVYLDMSSAQYRDAWRYVMYRKVGASEACHWAATNQCRVTWDGSKLRQQHDVLAKKCQWETFSLFPCSWSAECPAHKAVSVRIRIPSWGRFGRFGIPVSNQF